jgi:hypothetical protein
MHMQAPQTQTAQMPQALPQQWQTVQNGQQGWGQDQSAQWPKQEQSAQWPHQQAPTQHYQQQPPAQQHFQQPPQPGQYGGAPQVPGQQGLAQQPTVQNALQGAAFNAQMGGHQNQQQGQQVFGQQHPTFPGGAGTWGQQQHSAGEAAAVPTQRQAHPSPHIMPGVPPWQGTQPQGELQGGELPPPQPMPNQQLNSMQQQQPPHAMMGQQQQPAGQNAMMMHQPPGQQHFLQQQPSANMPVRNDIRKQYIT